ncbi:hypothetical protein [Bacillus salipaludis]|uniref:Uncharacterized protein n=1 Tax=Bacillus salipaludis TaxID=2547811 RepID=A0AA90R738_9BACI|nr:hypothetical protein [Bacillus salipaludis]MDQ6597198.1 hypothetical protein [Bacillus salipaludis]
MLYPYGNDYIKYLNDEGSYGMTYDQWKDKNSKMDSDHYHQAGESKGPLKKYSSFK